MIETIVALVVLGVAGLGALAGLQAAASSLTQSQVRQHLGALADARAQTYLLANKVLLTAQAVGLPATPPPQLALGAAPWQLDPSPPGTSPHSGAFFTLDALGKLTPVAVSGATGCGDSTHIPTGTFCREVLVTQGMPTSGASPSSGPAYTLWTRVSRMGAPASAAVVRREVILP